ncbi:MAG: class I SAM-dependent methyltransferase [Phycisphaerae bacterium]
MSQVTDTTFAEVPIDNVRAYWNSRPCNIRHSAKPVGTREYFDEVEKRKYFVEPHIPRLAEFNRWAGKKVLEIGCGIGTDTINFARAGATVTAVDLSDESLKVAQQRAEVYGVHDRVRFFRTNAEELSKAVPVEPYDLIYSFGVIHHTPHPGAVLDELQKFCTAQTELKVMVYNRWSWKVLWIVMTYGKGQFWREKELTAKYSEAQTGCPVTYSYSRTSGRAWLRQHGFEPHEVWVDHIFPYSIPEYKEYRYVKAWYWRWMPQPLFRLFERAWGWHLCMTARPVRR